MKSPNKGRPLRHLDDLLGPFLVRGHRFDENEFGALQQVPTAEALNGADLVGVVLDSDHNVSKTFLPRQRYNQNPNPNINPHFKSKPNLNPRLAAFYLAARDQGFEILFMAQHPEALTDARYLQMGWHALSKGDTTTTTLTLTPTPTLTLTLTPTGAKHRLCEILPCPCDPEGPTVVVLNRAGMIVERNASSLISRVAVEETNTLAPAAVIHWCSRSPTCIDLKTGAVIDTSDNECVL